MGTDLLHFSSEGSPQKIIFHSAVYRLLFGKTNSRRGNELLVRQNTHFNLLTPPPPPKKTN